MQYHVVQCNTVQHHAIPCITMQYHASLITADGAYHSPVGSITAIFIIITNIIIPSLNIRLNYILGYHTTYVGTPQALQLRDETMAILRMAVEH